MREVTEYVITLKNGRDFRSTEKSIADNFFEETPNEEIDQYYRKDWVKVDGRMYEDFVKVYYG
jgi:hypothetical protein